MSASMEMCQREAPSVCVADAKAQAAIKALQTPRDVKRHLKERQGYEAVLEACEQIWPAWSENGCRKLDLRVSCIPVSFLKLVSFGHCPLLEACKQTWLAWSGNGCRKLDLQVSC